MNRKYLQVLRNISIYLKNIFLKRSKANNRIVILSFKFLGDTVFTIPAIKFIQKKFPLYDIFIFCYGVNSKIYQLEFSKIDYIVYKKQELDLENRKFNLLFIKILKKINLLNASMLFDFTSNYKTALISYICNVERTYGFGNSTLQIFYKNFSYKKPGSIRHLFFNLIYLIDKSESIEPYLISKNNLSRPEWGNTVLFLPSAGWKSKEWGINNFINLYERIAAEYCSKIIAEPEFFPFDVIEHLDSSKINYRLTKNFDELLYEIKNCTVLISNDTGPLHIAALLGKYTFSIFGPTSSTFHLSTLNESDTVMLKLPCSPMSDEKQCFTFGGRIGCPSNECMNQLKFEFVYMKLRQFLEKIKLFKK